MNAPKPLDLAGVRRRQLHMFFLLDCSGSMEGENIRSLNYAMRGAVPEMRKAADDNVEVEVMVRAVCFADGAVWHIRQAIPVHSLEWKDVTAKGHTAMGAALKLVAEQLTSAGMPGPQLRPVIILVSDGKPTDDFAEGLRALDASPYGAKAIRIAIAIGADADEAGLRRFMGASDFKPLKAQNAGEIVEHIRWASSATIAAASRPTGGVQHTAPEGGTEAGGQKPSSSLVWD